MGFRPGGVCPENMYIMKDISDLNLWVGISKPSETLAFAVVSHTVLSDITEHSFASC